MRDLLRRVHQPALIRNSLANHRLTLPAAALLLLAAGCGTDAGPAYRNPDTAAASASAAACTPLPEAIGPDVAGSLGLPQDGGSFCLPVGQRLSVFLKVAPEDAAQGWGPPTASAPGVLARVPSGALTLVRGVTAGIFEGRHPGTATLTSSRAKCAEASTPCPVAWRVTVVVRPGG